MSISKIQILACNPLTSNSEKHGNLSHFQNGILLRRYFTSNDILPQLGHNFLLTVFYPMINLILSNINFKFG